MDRENTRAAGILNSQLREPDHVIPEEWLPPGFAARIVEPPAEPVTAVPAATVMLLRDSVAGPEAFLLRRNRSSGFVPGAYVFPGGRVEPADDDPSLQRRVRGVADSPPAAFWLAAMRETFEETGVLLGRLSTPATDDAQLVYWREALLEDRATLAEALDALGAEPDFTDVVNFAHWITPLAETRRFDTRFFAAALPTGAEAVRDDREMSDALWIPPAAALERFREGRLPMVFPTVHALQSIAGFETVAGVLAGLRARTVQTVLPRLVRTAGGVGIFIDQES